MPLPCNDGKSPMSSSLSMVIFPSGVIMIEKGIYKSVIGILTLAAKMIFLEFEVFFIIKYHPSRMECVR